MIGRTSRSSRKLALSVSSWFCVPEQGMTDFEVLSRASAFLVESRFHGKGKGARHRFPKGQLENSEGVDIEKLTKEQKDTLNSVQSFVPKYHIVTASHVVAPWLWPKYYPDEWLQHVNHQHTHYTVELRDEQGVFITQSECVPVSYHHSTRDLSVLHFEDEERHIEDLMSMNFYVPSLLLPPTADTEVDISSAEVTSSGSGEESTPTEDLYSHIRSDKHGGKLHFVGHDVTDVTDIGGMGGTLAGMRAQGDNRRPIPQHTLGKLHGRTNAQVFCTTNTPLTDGMCGGPVLWDASPRTVRSEKNERSDKPTEIDSTDNSSISSIDGKSDDHVIVGMVEGIVPLDYHDKAMRGLAVFVESKHIHEFLEAIEQGPNSETAGTRLIGGEALNHIARTQHEPEFQMPVL